MYSPKLTLAGLRNVSISRKFVCKIEEPSSYVLNLKRTSIEMSKKYLGGRELDQSIDKFEE
jgi:hypothetical protein